MISLTSEFSIRDMWNEDYFAHNHPEFVDPNDHRAVYFFKSDNKYMCYYCGLEPSPEIVTQALLLCNNILTVDSAWKDVFQDLRK